MHIQAPWRVLRRIGHGGGRGLRALLYGALLAGVSSGCATHPAPVASQPKPAPSVVARTASSPATAKPAPVEITPLPQAEPPRVEQPQAQPAQPAQPARNAYIAVLLPTATSSKALKPAVDQILDGVIKGARVFAQGTEPPLRVFETGDHDDDVLAQYNKAIDGGAAAVIGPLTRTAVNFLADNGQFPVPVIALNRFDSHTLSRPNLYSFSLSVEQDASEVARLMLEDGVRKPLVLIAASHLSQRMNVGFATAWRSLGHPAPQVLNVGHADQPLADLRAQIAATGADAVFLATDFKLGRKVRPFIGTELPVYATSQINPGPLPATAAGDLAGVRFVDMPWVVNADDPYYALFARARTQSNDYERMFALGVDAWRIAAALVLAPEQPVSFDGVTGRLSLGSDGVIERHLLPQRFGDGGAMPSARDDTTPDDGDPIL